MLSKSLLESVPQDVIGEPQASTPLYVGTSFASKTFLKRDFSLNLSYDLNTDFLLPFFLLIFSL